MKNYGKKKQEKSSIELSLQHYTLKHFFRRETMNIRSLNVRMTVEIENVNPGIYSQGNASKMLLCIERKRREGSEFLPSTKFTLVNASDDMIERL